MSVVLLKLPAVPVTLRDTVPGAAVPLAVSVNVLVLVVLLGLKDADTPLGKPATDKFTLLLKPFCGATVMVLVPVPPCRTVNAAGRAESPKVGIGVTVRDRLVVLTKLPEVPIMVTLSVPAAAVLPAVNVSVLLPVVLLGLKDAVTPFGRPEAVKLTLPVPVSALTCR